MKDKIIVVTGSTSGIGLGIASKFAKNGAKLVINGLASDTEVKELSSKLKILGAAEVLFDGADLSKPAEIDRMFKNIIQKYQRVDVLINNAGVDLIAAFYTIKNVIPIMKQQKWGRVINIASAHALVASPFKSAYVAAKHGLMGLTKSVALEVAQDGITVNSICPGYVKTPLVVNQIADTAKARSMSEEDVIKNVILGVQATKKFVEIEEIADFVYFLSSESASSITGSALSIDGGWTAQ